MFIEKPELVQVKLLGLVPGDLPEGHEPSNQLQQDEDDHEGVGGPLHRQDDQVLVEQQEALERELEQDRQEPESGQLRNLEF